MLKLRLFLLVALVSCGSFIAQVGRSEARDQKDRVACPKPDAFANVAKLYDLSVAQKKNQARLSAFVKALKKLFNRCKSPIDSHPIPALWLCEGHGDSGCSSLQFETWIGYLAASPMIEARHAFASPEFRGVLDGEMAETYRKESLKVEKELQRLKQR
jgi:hypothetical protein